jgi:20S proteasome alpha/beta subunit
MTICIGAICEKKYVVMATDRMITVRIPNIEYEQTGITKALEITPNCLAATAGSALAFIPVLRKAMLEITQGSIKDVSTIAERIRVSYVSYRNQKLEEEILSSVGLSLQSFYQSNQVLQPQLAASLFQAMQRYNYELWILIAGVDDLGGHLWHIENPGNKACLDNIGFHAVGSGQHHAVSTFIANEFDPTIDLSHGLAITFEAKKRSEKATGVGKLTDIVIISETKHRRLGDNEIAQLEEIYKKRIDTEKDILKGLDEKIKNLSFLSEYQ